MNRRVLGVVAAILLAAAGTWVLVQYVSQADERAIEGQEVVEVLVVDEVIPKGTPVIEVAPLVSKKLIPAAVRVPNALATLDPVRGLVTAVDLLPGEQLLSSRFAAEAELVEDARAIEVPEGLLELTISLTPERAVGAGLIPGDTVAVLSSFTPFTLDAVEPTDEDDLNSFINSEENTETITLTTPNSTGISVHKALVTRVQQRAPEDPTVERPASALPEGSLLISLAVAPGDAEQIVFTAEYGSIWLAREGAETPEADPVLIITRANVYR